jgi:hypothetical protein
MLRRFHKAVDILKDGGPSALVSFVRHHFDVAAATKRMDSVALSDMPASEKFATIYREKLWLKVHRDLNADKTLSGHGSTLRSTEVLRPELEAFLASIEAKCFVDAPCGDLNWMTKVSLPSGCKYIGGDVVGALIDGLKIRFERAHKAPDAIDRQFLVLDLTRDTLPDADAWLCRDCLQHLSFADVAAVIRNAMASNVEYFLLTNHYGVEANTDIATGQYRHLDLTLAPFHFPKPSHILPDENIDGEPHYIGVWRRQDLLHLASC